MKKLLILSTFVFLSVFFSCSSSSLDEDTDPLNSNKVTYNKTVKLIIDNNCLNCHSNPPVNGAPMSLTSYENVKEATENRGLIQRIEDGSMPSTGDKLTADQIQEIKDWKTDGFAQ